MTMSMFEASVPSFIHSLTALKVILEKGAAHADSKKIDQTVLVQTRLFPDMFPLSRQVQIATDAAKGAAARLAGVEPPKFEDNETTFVELIARVQQTIDYLQGFKASQIDGSEGRDIVLKSPRGERQFTGQVFLRHWALPNVFFHITTTYNILRSSGVELGKADFLGTVQG
ncbi:MAG TPA: DUF1993 domain-containing protein [Steroidobacteraceae bacterium]|jgi:hypothetical protein